MRRSLGAVAVLALAAAASAETWNFDLSTTGEDVFWVSPTSVDPAAFSYDAAYTITSVVATVSIFGSPVDVDVTSDVPADLLMGTTSAPGPAPVVLVDQFVASPPPPETPSLAADVRIELDAMGFAQASATNVVLGTVTVNVPPFGDLTVPLTGVSFMGTITFDPVLTRPEDLNADGAVGGADLAILLAAWGPCPMGVPCPADLDGDGVVSGSDLAILLAAWG